jgi:threonine aldolase
MRQAGVVAAACLTALHDHAPGLLADHARARAAATGLATIPGIVPQPRVDSNIVYFALGESWSVGAWRALAEACTQGGKTEVVDALSGLSAPVTAVPMGEEVSLAGAFIALLRALGNVKVGAYGTLKIRVVTHHQVSDEMVDRLVKCAGAAGRLLGGGK